MTDRLLPLAAPWMAALPTPGPNMLFLSGVALSLSGRMAWER